MNLIGAVELKRSLLIEAGWMRFAPDDLGLAYILAALILTAEMTLRLVILCWSLFSS